MKEISRAMVIAPLPVAWFRPARGVALRHSARPIGWPPAAPRRDQAGLSDAPRAVAIGLLIALLALAMLLLAVHVVSRSLPAGERDMRMLDEPGSCGTGDPGVPTRSETDGAPARIGAAFTC